jgi:hypothetical protein
MIESKQNAISVDSKRETLRKEHTISTLRACDELPTHGVVFVFAFGGQGSNAG